MAKRPQAHVSVRDAAGIVYSGTVDGKGDMHTLDGFTRADIDQHALVHLLVAVAASQPKLAPIVQGRLTALLELLPWYIPRRLGGLGDDEDQPIISLIDPDELPF